MMPEDFGTAGTTEESDRDAREPLSPNASAQTELDATGPGATHPARSPASGWLVGIVAGVLIGLWALPPVRYTLSSQLLFALAADGAPWTHPLEGHRTTHEIVLLDAAAATDSQDYLLQVGRATAMAGAGGLRPTTQHLPASLSPTDDRTLVRLTLLASVFPNHPGACAHLARYMMLDRVRLQRIELAATAGSDVAAAATGRNSRTAPEADAGTPRTIPAGHRDVHLMEWALIRGERLDPTNAFWAAMLATTYFAAGRDHDGLRELARVRQASRWDAYIYEEVLGQWRLYSLAYGDHGAAQKSEPLSLIAFPHLREMRHMAELARWLADRAAASGDELQALRIRHDLIRLGQIMRETAPWAYEALYGTEILLIGSTDTAASAAQIAIRTTQAWQAQAPHYLAMLGRHHRQAEARWITEQVQAGCTLRTAVDVARSDASFPGIPPGIPLAALFGDWMTGICLIQQALALTVLALGVAFVTRRRLPALFRSRHIGLVALLIVTFSSGALIFLGTPSTNLALLFLGGITLLTLLGLQRLTAVRASDTHQNRKSEQERGPDYGTSIPLSNVARRKVPRGRRTRQVEAMWTSATTVRLLAVALIPGVLALQLAQPALGRLHPVAQLLTSLVGGPQLPDGWDALREGLLAGAVPLVLALLAGCWGAARRVSPLTAARTGIRHMTVPALACLMVVYLLLMQRTLRLDALCSHAINEAARNDREWVLTHAGDSD